MRAVTRQQRLDRPRHEPGLHLAARAGRTVDEGAAALRRAAAHPSCAAAPSWSSASCRRRREVLAHIPDGRFATAPERLEHAQLQRPKHGRQARRFRRRTWQRIAKSRGRRCDGPTSSRKLEAGSWIASNCDARMTPWTCGRCWRRWRSAPLKQKGHVYEPKYDGIRALIEIAPARGQGPNLVPQREREDESVPLDRQGAGGGGGAS